MRSLARWRWYWMELHVAAAVCFGIAVVAGIVVGLRQGWRSDSLCSRQMLRFRSFVHRRGELALVNGRW